MIHNFLLAQGETPDSLEGKPIAEFWMGCHPKAESQVLTDSKDTWVPLTEFLANLGLPPLRFLFKVLSIEKCLSLQAHPDKSLAAKLHVSDPANYPDANHKPEMSITLTDFEAFSNFASFPEITANLKKYATLDSWLLANTDAYQNFPLATTPTLQRETIKAL